MTTAVDGSAQRWRVDGIPTWRAPEHGVFRPAGWDVTLIPEAKAAAFVHQLHYTRSMPAARLCIGLTTSDDRAWTGHFVGGRHLAGVAVISVPMQRRVLTNVFPTLEPYHESAELGRLVLADGVAFNGETWFVSRVNRLASAHGLKGLVMFSDPMPRSKLVTTVGPDGEPEQSWIRVMPGHVGVIYQALNAYACGKSTPRTVVHLPWHGLTVSDRTLSKIRKWESGAAGAVAWLIELGAPPMRQGEDPRDWLARAFAELEAVKRRHRGCWRYALVIGGSSNRRVITPALPRTPYPRIPTGLEPEPLTIPLTYAT